MEGPPGEVPVLKSLWLRGGLCRHFDNWQEFAHDVPPIGDPDRIRTGDLCLDRVEVENQALLP